MNMRLTEAMGRTERDQKSEDVRCKITSTALSLFISRGYAETTIREISAASAVSSGSIYHFFGDKEGIFQQIALSMFQRGLGVANQRLSPDDSPYLHLALRWAGVIRMISTNERAAELLSVAYRSQKISDMLMPMVCGYHRDILGERLVGWSQDRLHITTLLLKGALSSLIDERLQQNQLGEEQRMLSLLGVFLPAFGADADTTREVTGKTMSLLANSPNIIAELLVEAGSSPRA